MGISLQSLALTDVSDVAVSRGMICLIFSWYCRTCLASGLSFYRNIYIFQSMTVCRDCQEKDLEDLMKDTDLQEKLYKASLEWTKMDKKD